MMDDPEIDSRSELTLDLSIESREESVGMAEARASRWAVRLITGLLLTIAVVYLIVIPGISLLWESLITSEKQPGIRKLDVDMNFAEWARLRSIEAVFGVVVFFLGASIGSFLNVVVYRLPNRIPLFMRRSRCPQCQGMIRSEDNVPLLGWLRLGGRCRDCKNPISFRYPLVEGIMGAIFLWLFSVQFTSGGWNLPNRLPNLYTGIVWVLFYVQWDLLGYYLFHCLLFAMVLVVALIDIDKNRLTSRQVFMGTCGLVVPAIVWPNLLRWPISGIESPYLSVIVTQLVGGVLGWTIGSLANWRSQAKVALLWIGVALGWQAVLGTTGVLFLLGLCIWLPFRLVSTPQANASFNSYTTSFTAWLLCALLIHHSLWRLLTISCEPWWPSGKLELLPVLLWMMMVGLFLALFWWLRPPRIAGEQIKLPEISDLESA